MSGISPALFWVTLSLLTYMAARAFYARIRFALFHPILVTMALIIALLRIGGIDYDEYMSGGRVITFFLGPSVVALGLPLYLRLQELKRSAPAMLTSVLFASAVGIVSVVIPALMAGAPAMVVRSLAPKSVTTPIAIVVSESIGGDASLTAAVVVVTGILGAVIGPLVLRLVGVVHPVSFGLAMGAAAHGIGTARALEEGELQGAAAGLGICICGVMTAVLTPPIVGLLLG